MSSHEKRGRRGAGAVETACVLGALALLMGLGFATHRSVRLGARVALAESRLKQVATALELYHRNTGTYPPQGANLAEELAPYVDDANIFRNPLMDEAWPGQTISLLYRAPTATEVDRPHLYLTAMVADNGHTSVILWTGQEIERREDMPFDPNDPQGFHASLNPGSGSGGQPGDGGVPIQGSVEINPNKNTQFEFSMETPDGIITRDMLLEEGSSYEYTGSATQIRVCPKGDGSQNTMTVGGQPLQNGTLYIIASQAMTVHLYNSNANTNGNKMGQWWIDITTDCATVTTGL